MRTGIAALLALVAGAVAQDFPDWRDARTRAEIGWRQATPDTLPSDQGGTWYVIMDAPGSLRKDSLVWLDVRSHPVLSLAMWPIEKGAGLLSRYAFDPLEGAALYAEREELVDRGVRLVQIDAEGKVMFYPTMAMDGGPGSRLGATYINHRLFGSTGSFRLGGSLMLSRDWYASTSIASPRFGSSGISTNLLLSAARAGEQALWIPGEAPIGSGKSPGALWEARRNVELGLTVPLGSYGAIEPTIRFARREIREPVRQVLAIGDVANKPWFAYGDRGINPSDENSLATGFVWGKGNVNFEGTPSEGGTQGLSVLRSWSHGGGDGVSLSMDATRYLLLGDEKYGYRKGDLDPYLNLSPKVIVGILDPSTLRKRLTQRRILALQVSARQLWEMEPHRDPVSYFNFPSLGGEAPARAYSGRRLTDRAVVGATAEYRWPIWRYIDGSMFLELAWAGRHWWEPNGTGLAPGTGLGLRVRTPSQFLFRAQFAYGLEGPRAILTVSPEF